MRVTCSKKVGAKATSLAVRCDGPGRFSVASGTVVGLIHTVTAPAGSDPADPGDWFCDCFWTASGGRRCSHIVAAARCAIRQEGRRRRAMASGAPEPTSAPEGAAWGFPQHYRWPDQHGAPHEEDQDE